MAALTAVFLFLRILNVGFSKKPKNKQKPNNNNKPRPYIDFEAAMIKKKFYV